MKASKTLGKPENWQDFESLCKRLWGEIWRCPEIKKNGRVGQIQNGVDVYGIPSNEEEYYGIQCKGKDEYTHKQLTIKEINDEIEKAKTFEPKLKKLYFVTTAVKDAEIEKEIRLKNLEHKKDKLFEVHIFSWEDIVDLIEENRGTYDYYVNSINFKSSNSAAVTFQDNTTEITICPRFRQKIIHYFHKIDPEYLGLGFPIINPLGRKLRDFPQIASTRMNKTEINHSFSSFHLRLHNTGDAPIEEYKIFLEFEGEIKELSNTNEKVVIGFSLSSMHPIFCDTFLDSDTMTGKILPRETILVADDTFDSDEIFIKPSPKESTIVVKWKLISKNFKDMGDLLIRVKPDIEIIYKDVAVEEPLKSRNDEDYIEDYIIEKDDEN